MDASRPPSASSIGVVDRAFLQRRVAGVLAGTAGLLGVFFVYAVLEANYSNVSAWSESPSAPVHLGALVILTLTALYCWRGERTVRELYVAEALGLVTFAGLLALMSLFVHIGFRPEFSMAMGMTIVIVARGALVPSSARHTAVLCAVLAVLLAWLTWTLYADYQPPAPPPGVAPYPPFTSQVTTIFMLVWWFAASAMAVTVSHVIYGLRRDVARAERLGQYTLEEMIGEGGMGQVYRASHAMLRRPTAIKLVADAGPDQLRRFEREVQLTASLTHPNTIAIYDYGRTPEGVFYYAMEYLEGLNLDELVRSDGPQPVGRVVHILTQVCGALAEAHAAGLIHRDIKPGNVILCRRGGLADVAKVLDFGLVKDVKEASSELTTPNAVVGTPLYMAPEAITDPDEVEPRSDLYALGAVGFYLLTGRSVFEGKTLVEICAHHLHTPAARPSEFVDGVPTELDTLLLSCLAKSPDERPANACELKRQLEVCARSNAWHHADAERWWEAHELEVSAKRAPHLAARTVRIELARRGR